MVLNDEQCLQFFETMDALLYYVNGRFRVVEGFSLEAPSALEEMKANIVAHELWENAEVIDDFIRDNPARLPESCLQLAAQWKDALPGFYTVVRYQGGRALMMSDVGVFSVSGVTEELEQEIGPAPAYVEMVLLPFQNEIVYDGFLKAYGTSYADERQVIQDEFEDRCAGGIISTGAEFQRVARAYLDEKRNQELDALLADVERQSAPAAEVLPEGFHRGPLAGLSEEDRAAALIEAKRELTRTVQAEQQIAESIERTETAVKMEQAVNCAIACVVQRGVVAVREAYEQYCALVPEPLDYEQFHGVLDHEASFGDSFFGFWEYGETDYVVYYSLTPDYVAQQMSLAGDWAGLPSELEYYETYKRNLLEARQEVPVKPLSRTLLENQAINEVLAHPSIRHLRNYLDERIPDGQDDYLFADRVAEDTALSSFESGSLEAVFNRVHAAGLEGCAADETKLVMLVTNVFNAMPSWENNGWSPQELYEQLTGRRMFYNEDGSVKRVGADDPCPCGSGLKYRECCGR